MHRNLPSQPGDGSDGKAPTEAWLFAQAVRGKPIPRIVRPEVLARAKRAELEERAPFSSRHAAELRSLQSDEAQASHDRELLEFRAQISTKAADELRAMERQEAEEREAWRRAEEFVEMLEGNWDPGQPRAPKGQPDGGQWIAKGGGTGGGSVTPVMTTSYSGPKKVDAQQVSWHPPVGHHWVPVGVTQHPDVRPLLSDEAVEYGAGAYSGPTDPHHRNTTLDEVTHREYSAEVRSELQKFIEQNKISKTNKMTPAQMEEFTNLIENGLGANGQPHDFIGPYNRAIKGMLRKGTVRPSKLDDIMAAGRKYMKHSRFRLLAAGAVVSGILGEVIAQQVKLLSVASSSGLYRKALKALQDGDLSKARNLLIGDHDSLYHEILGQVGAHAALNFKAAVEKVFANAQNRDYK
jgi:hypothetical protein